MTVGKLNSIQKIKQKQINKKQKKKKKKKKNHQQQQNTLPFFLVAGHFVFLSVKSMVSLSRWCYIVYV